ncbi:hypothetical protein PAXRUDRAFT_821424 [Paxillus rubicundulus Ve08.2h10]|uniref:Chromatin modification-related protein n=1 Tax=Paxillus rubicundulus Ve08.2h10 TaxID=930991 RepID=A0A0D0ED76_9AGAM|nr:hypothetical protein PAXRUDRAFT_821424 [Paxillus rubicundulus Ve08.2h10]
MGRKRRRSQAFPADEDGQAAATLDEDQAQDSKSQTDEEELAEERKKELAVWETFKEEHHEVLEQLPLSLHRQFKLVRELDTQSTVFHTDLLSYVRRYVDLRRSLASRTPQEGIPQPTQASSPKPTEVDQPNADQAGLGSPSPMLVDSAEPRQIKTAVTGNSKAKGTSPTPPLNHTRSTASFHPKPGKTTRDLLQQISQTSEEAIRTAEEKVSIALTAYETVDRHIRLLDQAIKEQEAAISLGMRPGTHLAPILLPDLVVPRWARPSRVEYSPVPALSPELELHVTEKPQVLGPPEPLAPSSKPTRKGRKPAAQQAAGPEEVEKEKEPAMSAAAEAQELPRTRRSGVRLTIPALTGPTVPADPNEVRYCYCNQVSFGTMIACDNEACKLEWFHLGCTGLSEVPNKKTKWYCRECRPKMMQRGRPRS